MFAKGNQDWKSRKGHEGGRPRKHHGDDIAVETSIRSEADAVVETVQALAGVVDDETGRELALAGEVAVAEVADEAELGYLRDIANPKKRALLAAYAQSGSLTKAARMSGYSMSSHYHWQESDPV